MTFIRNIRQKLCKHYFVFDADSCLYNENKEISQPAFKCSKCGEVLHYNGLLISEAMSNTAYECATWRQKYFALLKIVDPERYVNELKKEGIA